MSTSDSRSAEPVSHWLESPWRRLIELLVVSPVVVVTAPLTAVVAVAVAKNLGRPVLVRQVRSGKNGRPIRIAKFRSMTEAVDHAGKALPDVQRLSGLGRFLRASSLDELPQLATVVSGEMSLIGPRPLPAAYDERYTTEQARRLAVRPGLTGWAQVHGRNEVAWPDRLALDVWYVEHASWRLDLSIVVRTVWMLVRTRGVPAEGHTTMPEFTGSPAPSPG
jgi:lipopolysaccharide/colanic/teichoic acid biosynthesis glycosyltransferase